MQPNLNEDDLLPLIVSLAERGKTTKNPLPHHLLVSFNQVLLKHRHQIQRFLQTEEVRNRVLNQAMHKLDPSFQDADWKAPTGFPIFKTLTGEHAINVLTGEYTAPGGRGDSLPPATFKNDLYQKLFGNRKFKTRKIAPSVYQFQDHNGYATQISFNQYGELTVNRKINDQWYLWMPAMNLKLDDPKQRPENPPTKLGSYGLVNNYDHWLRVKDSEEILIIDPKTQKPRYRAQQLQDEQIMR